MNYNPFVCYYLAQHRINPARVVEDEIYSDGYYSVDEPGCVPNQTVRRDEGVTWYFHRWPVGFDYSEYKLARAKDRKIRRRG